MRFPMILAIALLSCSKVFSQDSYEIQVYGSELVPVGKTMVELHSNYTIEGQKNIVNGVLPSNHALHETIEITHGFTEWFETGFYIFTSVEPGYGMEWVGDHIRPRISVPASWQWPVGLSLSTEVGYRRRLFSENTWNWEIRPIIDKQIGLWYVALNPAFGKAIHGPSSNAGFDFSPSCKISYDITKKVAIGMEYYSTLGALTHFEKWNDQEHQIFPTVDLNFSENWEFNFGVGIGLTKSTDDLMVKLILGRRF
jgi:hypothetical protein